MTSEADLYALLQVHPKASPEVIKKAYHALMQKNHPDRGGDLALAKQLNMAYDILIDDHKRQRYDHERQMLAAWEQEAREKRRKAKIAEARAKAAAAAPPAPKALRQLSGDYRSPMLWGQHLLVADERGNRVLIQDLKGDTVWTYGKRPGETLRKPRLAQFTPNGEILIADTGAQRVLRVNLKGEQTWVFAYPELSPQARGLAHPAFVHSHGEQVLIADTGQRQVFAVDGGGKVIWRFNGKLAFNLRFQHQLIQPERFMPVSVFALGEDRYLVADQGNGRVLEISAKGKLHWIYPDKKQPPLPALNFAYRLANGNTWLCSDKMVEIGSKGEMVWHYARLSDADIKQAYPLADSSFMMDFSHLVKRGINQEVMILDHNTRIQYRHYYSQHRFL